MKEMESYELHHDKNVPSDTCTWEDSNFFILSALECVVYCTPEPKA